ncbi:D-lactonohydrolase-like protein [Armillaria borealis]|uniref:D-lactonohydrolase-like protein n=1 Tax=Armillaria borealis TaxID=47425 RepID=A0AA39J852_9AGAR|nr:D-lactonohydrolase-like protein [Armillaria borealis]
MPFMPYLVVALVALVAFAWAKMFPGGMQELRLPPQSVLVDPRLVATLGANASFREDSFDSHFNPTNTSPPFFQIFDRSFLAILGSSPSIHEVASNDTFAFAHEAPVYDPSSDEVFFASNDGGLLGMSDLEHNNQISKLSLSAAEAVKGSSVPVTPLILPDTIQMTNGGTGPYKSSLLLITSGRGRLPPSIALVDPNPPHNVTVLLDNYFGRQFNSLNDIKVHPSSGKIFFTDVTYGFLNHFRPAPQMPNQVYRFDPDTGVFSGDGNTAYVTDTGAVKGFFGNNQTEPATIYAFDVDPKSHAFMNRRVFAYVDSGIPDGIQVDTDGNVYSGCGDGVQVWNNEGTLLGKFFLGTTSANMVFAGKGRLIILAETKVFLAKIAAKGVPLGGP